MLFFDSFFKSAPKLVSLQQLDILLTSYIEEFIPRIYEKVNDFPNLDHLSIESDYKTGFKLPTNTKFPEKVTLKSLKIGKFVTNETMYWRIIDTLDSTAIRSLELEWSTPATLLRIMDVYKVMERLTLVENLQIKGLLLRHLTKYSEY